MGDFWDARAKENAYYYVDNRLDYGSPDIEQFWADAEQDVDTVLGAVGGRILPTDVVVEIGCGLGRLTRVLAARAREVIAIDVSTEMLALAREHNAGVSNVSWLQGDGSSLAGVEDAVADVCFSHVVFQHIPDPGVTLGYVAEMGRVLKPGGWAAFQVSNDPDVHRPSRRAKARRRVRRLVRGGPRGQSDPEWLGSAVDLDSLREAADAGGMEVEAVAGEGTRFCLLLLRRAS